MSSPSGSISLLAWTVAVALLASTIYLWDEGHSVCMPLFSDTVVRVLDVGQNMSAAKPLKLRWHLWPLRPHLLNDLLLHSEHGQLEAWQANESSRVFDAEGFELRCASELQSWQYIYVSKRGIWQWAPEYIGFRRAVRVHWQPVLTGPPGTQEDGAESPSRLTDQGGSQAESVVLLTTLSAEPPIYLVSPLLEAEAMDELIANAGPLLGPSKVSAPPAQKKRTILDPRRISQSAWLHGYNDPRRSMPAARGLQRRVASLLRLPFLALPIQIEPVMVVRGIGGSFYEPHDDFFSAEGKGSRRYHPLAGSNRMATLLLSLSHMESDTAGGQTFFPFAQTIENISEIPGSHDAAHMSSPACNFPSGAQARGGLMVRPKRGEALLWYSQLPSGELDRRTRHGGCPVSEGVKYSANVWVWNRRVVYASGGTDQVEDED